MQEIKRVPDFHTFCTITRCADVCLSHFHYSPVLMCVYPTFTTCTKGQYNGMCNVHITGNNPLGPRNPETTCGKSAKTIFAFCQKCPTWVLHGDSISIVAACGVRGKYTGWAWDENSGTSALLLDVNFASILVVHNYEL
jgi:hypothetical protein